MGKNAGSDLLPKSATGRPPQSGPPPARGTLRLRSSLEIRPTGRPAELGGITFNAGTGGILRKMAPMPEAMYPKCGGATMEVREKF
jgi:hypothetical protein